MQTKSILLADDDVEDIELLEEVILSLDPETTVHTVVNGKEAVDYLSALDDSSLPHIIVLDYNMPVMTGLEVLQQLSAEARYRHIPKLVWSTSNTPYHIQECKEKGAMQYLVKPGSMQELTQLATKILALCQKPAN